MASTFAPYFITTNHHHEHPHILTLRSRSSLPGNPTSHPKPIPYATRTRHSTQQAPKPVFNALAPQPYGASPYPSATEQPKTPASSSILPPPQFQNTLQPSDEDTEPIKQWREKQRKEIEERDARDKEKREEMKNKAEKSIDQFYEDYNKQKEKNIRENKWVLCSSNFPRRAQAQ